MQPDCEKYWMIKNGATLISDMMQLSFGLCNRCHMIFYCDLWSLLSLKSLKYSTLFYTVKPDLLIHIIHESCSHISNPVYNQHILLTSSPNSHKGIRIAEIPKHILTKIN